MTQYVDIVSFSGDNMKSKSIMVMMIEAKIKEFLAFKEWDHSEDLQAFLEWISENERF